MGKSNKDNETNNVANNDSDTIENQEQEIENMVDKITSQIPGKNILFSINASNQAGLNWVSNGQFSQINALIILINPYSLDSLNFSDIDVDIRMNSNGSVIIDGKEYKVHQVQPGIGVFGISEEKGL